MRRTWLPLALACLFGTFGVGIVRAQEGQQKEDDVQSVQISVNGETMAAPGFVVQGEVYVPIAALAKALGIKVQLDASAGKLFLETPPAPTPADPKAAAAVSLVKEAKSFAGVAGQPATSNDKHLVDAEMKFRDEPIKIIGWAAEPRDGGLFLVSFQYVPLAGKAITVWAISEPELTVGSAKDAPRGWFWEADPKSGAVEYINGNAELERKYKLIRAQ